MATLLDALGILKTMGFYQTVFPFILVLAFTFGVLSRFKPFGDNKYLNGVIATIVALFFISMVRASAFLASLIPMITAIFIALLFLVLIFMFMGVKEEKIAEVVTTESPAYFTLFAIFLIVVFIVLSQVFPEQAFMTQFPGLAKEMNVSIIPENATPGQEAAAILSAQAGAIIFSPTILSLIVLFLTFAIAAYFIVREKGGKGGG